MTRARVRGIDAGFSLAALTTEVLVSKLQSHTAHQLGRASAVSAPRGTGQTIMKEQQRRKVRCPAQLSAERRISWTKSNPRGVIEPESARVSIARFVCPAQSLNRSPAASDSAPAVTRWRVRQYSDTARCAYVPCSKASSGRISFRHGA